MYDTCVPLNFFGALEQGPDFVVVIAMMDMFSLPS